MAPRWDAARKEALRCYRLEHSLKETAEHFGLSSTRVTQVLRKEACLAVRRGRALPTNAALHWGFKPGSFDHVETIEQELSRRQAAVRAMVEEMERGPSIDEVTARIESLRRSAEKANDPQLAQRLLRRADALEADFRDLLE